MELSCEIAFVNTYGIGPKAAAILSNASEIVNGGDPFQSAALAALYDHVVVLFVVAVWTVFVAPL
jgi:hypothetical protein